MPPVEEDLDRTADINFQDTWFLLLSLGIKSHDPKWQNNHQIASRQLQSKITRMLNAKNMHMDICSCTLASFLSYSNWIAYPVHRLINNGSALWNNWNQLTDWLDQEQPFNANDATWHDDVISKET